MCGFSGYFSFEKKIDASLIDALEKHTQLLVHRGPDHHGFHTEDRCVLGHQRLSILDTSERAHQPFRSQDGRYTLVFNGEIYNFKALRSKLELTGTTFESDSDTEVLLHWLISKGPRSVEELNGCFAFALYDKNDHSLVLGRDPLGIKPLYFQKTEEGIAFASEFRALLNTNIKLKAEEVSAYLQFTYLPSRTETLVEGINKLEAGSTVHFVGKTNSYPTKIELAKQRRIETNNPEEKLRFTLEEAVKDRLIADVPVGTFLSGGLDSSLISALAAKHHKDLNTFSIGFENAVLDESVYAKKVAEHIGSRHHHFIMNMDDLEQHARRFLATTDLPFADSSAIAVSFLAEKTREHVTVALSGDGADELFGGYNKHRAFALAQKPGTGIAKAAGSVLPASRESKLGNLGRKLQRLGELSGLDESDRYAFLASFNRINFIEETTPDAFFAVQEALDDPLDQLLHLDQMLVLEGDMLVKQDRMSMQHSLEVRVPFLDTRVVALANAIPSERKFNSREGKIVLKECFADLLPKEIFGRRKHGFEVPIETLMRERFAAEIEELARANVFAKLPFKKELLHETIQDWMSGNANHTSLMWALLVLVNWDIRNGVQS